MDNKKAGKMLQQQKYKEDLQKMVYILYQYLSLEFKTIINFLLPTFIHKKNKFHLLQEKINIKKNTQKPVKMIEIFIYI